MRKSSSSIHDVIGDAVSQVMRKVIPAVQRRVAAMAAEELERKLARKRGEKRARRSRRRARVSGVDLTKWVADRRARRVPNFVIEMTGGLDTKKKIVARYGEDAAFEKGKPLPPAAAASQRNAPAREGIAARVVKAKPPVIRKSAAG